MKIIKENKNTKKIKKLTEEEAVATKAELEKDIDDGTTADASIADLADAVTAEAELASGGKETYSESKAEAIAKKIKAACQDFNQATWAPLEVPNKFTKKLDACLANSRYFKYHGSSAGTDLLVTGLPGSGKTAIFKNWCKERGVEYKYINAKDEDLSAAINGFSVHEVEERPDGKKIHSVVQAGSKKLLSLIDTPTVLFLDEFNRAPQQLRAQLLTLVNEHQVAGEDPDDPNNKTGFIDLQGLLFTVACINPDVATDPGALTLNQAERSRMVNKLTLHSNTPDALNYLSSYFKKRISLLDPKDPMFKYSYERDMRTYNLAMALLSDPRFEFDKPEDQEQLDMDGLTMLNQRLLTDALESHGYSKEAFLDWVDESEMLPKNISMIHDILDGWFEPPVTLPDSVDVDDTAATDNKNNKDADSADEDDFFKALAGDDEDDTDLFGSTTSAAGKAAIVNPQDALQRIKSFDFIL